MVRCKFRVTSKSQSGDSVCIGLTAVVDGSEENKQFFGTTPNGNITFWTVNAAAAEQFNEGDQFYVDFTPAPKANPPTTSS